MTITQRLKALCWIFFLSVSSAASQHPGSFANFISQISLEPPSQRSAHVDSFMTARSSGGLPIVEDSKAYFVYRGKVTSSIAVTGDQTQWSQSGEPLKNISGTDFYFLAEKFEPDARIDYKFIVDREYILDPLNPHEISGGFGPNSELAMPAYIQPKEVLFDSSISHGTVKSFYSRSRFIDDTLMMKVYLPPNYRNSARRFPSMYVHDGPDYLSLASMANVLDKLIALKKIQPLICIFVPPGADRAGKYRLEKRVQFASFITKELVPYVDSAYRTEKRSSRRGSMGCSDGGHFALWLGVEYSGTFGLAGGQSSTITDLLTTPIQKGPKLPVRFYFDVGTYDIMDPSYNFLVLNRAFHKLLESKGYDVTYAEFHEGHSWGNWRAHVANLLTALFPPAAAQHQRKQTR